MTGSVLRLYRYELTQMLYRQWVCEAGVIATAPYRGEPGASPGVARLGLEPGSHLSHYHVSWLCDVAVCICEHTGVRMCVHTSLHYCGCTHVCVHVQVCVCVCVSCTPTRGA